MASTLRSAGSDSHGLAGFFERNFNMPQGGVSVISRPAGMSDNDWQRVARLPHDQARRYLSTWAPSTNTASAPAGTGTTSDITKLLGQYEQSQQDAKAANEQRYQDILKGYQDRVGRMMGYADRFQQTGQENIQRGLQKAMASNQQSAMSRGLGNTTVVDSLQRGAQQDAAYQERQLADQINLFKAQQDAAASGDLLQFQERRTDSYPDQGLMTQLLMALGAAGQR